MKMEIFDIATTVFYKQAGDELKQVAVLKIPGGLSDSKIAIVLENNEWSKQYSIDIKGIKDNRVEVLIPEVRKDTVSKAILSVGGRKIAERKIILKPHRKWEIYLHPFSHLDPGYTDLPSRVIEKIRYDLNDIISYCNETDSLDDDSKYRWNIESGYWLEKSLELLDKKAIIEVKSLIKNGRIEITPFYEPHISEFCDDEALVRSMYFCFRFASECGVKIESAMATDIPCIPWSIPQILARSGVKYLSTAANIVMAAHLKLPRPFYWEGQDGSRILLLDTDDRQHYQESVMLGFSDDLNTVTRKLPEYLEDLEEKDSRFDFDLLSLRDPGSLGDNTKPNVNICYIVEKWNKKWRYPRLRISVYKDYFKRFEEKYSHRLKTFKAAWPDYWISNSASAAFETGVNRITHNNKIIAERMCTMLMLLDPEYRYPAKKIEDIYHKIIIEDRSGWANDVSILEPDNYRTKGEIAENFANVYRTALSSSELVKNSGRRLAENIINNAGINSKNILDKTNSIVVTNICNWKRSDIAEVLVPKRLIDASKGIRIYDTENGRELRSQILEPSPEDNYRERFSDYTRVAFFAEDVPALGMKSFRVVFDKKNVTREDSHTDSGMIENKYYTVRFDKKTGRLEDLIDKDIKTGIIDHSSSYDFNQLIYENPERGKNLNWKNPLVREGKVTIPYNMIYLNPVFEKEFGESYRYPSTDNRMKRISPGNQKVISIKTGLLFTELITRSSMNCLFPDIICRFILENCSKRIFIKNFISKIEKMDAEAVYFAFPFNIEKPSFGLNCHNGYFEPEKQQLPGSNRSWYCSQKWVEIYNSTRSITWSALEAPLIQIGDINTSKWLERLESENAGLFSYVMNNYWFTAAVASQGGRNWFNYCFTSRTSTFDPAVSFKFGHSFHYPMTAEFLEDSPDVSVKFEMIGDIPNNIIVNGLKKSEEDNSLTIRFLEITGSPVSFTFKLKYGKLREVFEADPVEEIIRPIKLKKNSIEINIGPYELKTYRLYCDT